MRDEVVKNICSNECGARCCYGDVFLTQSDIKRISDSGKSDFLRQGSCGSVEDSGLMKTNRKDGSCFFLSDEKICSIYEKRPIDCQIFPFGYVFDGDCVMIVLCDCPLSRRMGPDAIEAQKKLAREKICKFTREEMAKYDEIPFSHDYEVLERIPVSEIDFS
jgi:Fe-S-cluster containining protein